MDTATAILATLKALPNHKITGKKRLQKFIYLLQERGQDCEAEFELRNFGPFSVDVARAVELLSFTGKVDESEEVVGSSRLFTTAYEVEPTALAKTPDLAPAYRSFLEELDKFTTIDLEIAATIRFFTKRGSSGAEAIDLTKRMKPTKSIPRVLEKADEVLRLFPN